MRGILLLLGLAVLGAGCKRRDESPKPAPAPSVPSEEAAEDRQEPEVLGQPLRHWTERAGAPEGRARTVEALTLALGDERGWVRVAAADALGRAGSDAKTAAPALAGLLSDNRAWVRVAAMETLAELGVDAIPALSENLRTGTPPVRLRTALVLGSMGPVARETLPLLKEALAESSPSTLESVTKMILADPAAKAAAPARPATAGDRAPATPPGKAEPGKAGFWPQFRGPDRDGLSPETGLLKEWPENGLKLLWRLEGLGSGYSSISISDGKIFTMGDRQTQGDAKAQFVIAYDAETRKELWAAPIGPPHQDGPRCTPTLDGERLYAIGTAGDLACLEAATGKIRWSKNFGRDFGAGKTPHWKFSESPLVDGEKVLCTPGGKEAALVALDKATGEVIWKSALPELGELGKDEAGYSSIVAAEIAGTRQYVQMHGRGVVGVDAASGRFLWGYNRVANSIANITTPVVRGDFVFATTAYNTGSALLKIVRDGDGFRAEEVYFLEPGEFQNHHGGVVLVGDFLYGGSGGNKGDPVCVEFSTGRVAWKSRAPARGSAAVIYADGRLIFRYDRGTVFLVEATPEAFRIKGQFQADTGNGPAWAHPVVLGGKLYLRHDTLLMCYDVRGGE